MPPKERREEVGSRSASHTHCRLFNFRQQHRTLAIRFWRFLRLCQRPNGAFEPEMYFKTTQDSGHFWGGAFGGYANDRMVHLSPKCILKQHRTLANFVFCGFGSFSFPNAPLGVKLGPLRTLKVQWGHPVFSAAGVGSRSASHTHYRRIFVLKTAQDARQFFVWRLLAPFRSQIQFLVPNCTHLGP